MTHTDTPTRVTSVVTNTHVLGAQVHNHRANDSGHILISIAEDTDRQCVTLSFNGPDELQAFIAQLQEVQS